MVNNDHVEVCDLCTDPVQVLLLKKKHFVFLTTA